MAEKKNKSKLKAIALLLITLGIIFLVVFAVYIVQSYPMGVLLKGGMVDVEDLPEPGLLPQAVDASGETTEQPSQGGEMLTKLGTIKIPSIQLSENIVEGSGNELLYGVGHIPGTAELGQTGNCALAGHRNYIKMHPFRFMDKLMVGDMAYVTDDTYLYTYEIFDIVTVNANDGWVLNDQGEDEAILTLVTCTPVLNPVNRLIAWGTLIDTTPIAKEVA